MEFCDILKYGNNLKLEIIDYIFRKIITLNEVNILESPNEYYQKQVYKNTTQDRGPFLFSHNLNEILQYIEMWYEFKV